MKGETFLAFDASGTEKLPTFKGHNIHALNPKAKILPFFNDAIIGIEQNTLQEWVVIYSVPAMLDELLAEFIDELEAKQFIFNQVIPPFINRSNGPIFRTGRENFSIQMAQNLIDSNVPLLTEACSVICLELEQHDPYCVCNCHKHHQLPYYPGD